jgi:hypothetical protein
LTTLATNHQILYVARYITFLCILCGILNVNFYSDLFTSVFL